MGLHQDQDESERSIAAGVPIVSISLGDTARFLFGGSKRRDPGRLCAVNKRTGSRGHCPERLRAGLIVYHVS